MDLYIFAVPIEWKTKKLSCQENKSLHCP